MPKLSILDATAVGQGTSDLIVSYAESLEELAEAEKTTTGLINAVNVARSELCKVRELAYEAMTTEGHYKQWFIVEIAKTIGMVIDDDIDAGTRPYVREANYSESVKAKEEGADEAP